MIERICYNNNGLLTKRKSSQNRRTILSSYANLFPTFFYEHIFDAVLMKNKFWLKITVVTFMINVIILSALSNNITLINMAFGNQEQNKNQSGEESYVYF
jgi:hypothetical protein